jgi:ATP synthase protein I
LAQKSAVRESELVLQKLVHKIVQKNSKSSRGDALVMARAISKLPTSDLSEADEPVKVLTRQEAEALRAKDPSISLWRVVGAQALAGLLVAILWWAVSGKFEGAASALYGAATITVPQALMARGLSGMKQTGPGGMVAGFMLWQFVKIGFAVLMLLGAGMALKWIVWPALLVAMVVCTKMNWLALLMRGHVAKKLGTKH